MLTTLFVLAIAKFAHANDDSPLFWGFATFICCITVAQMSLGGLELLIGGALSLVFYLACRGLIE